MSNLILGKDVLTDWKIYPLDIDGAIAGGWLQSDCQQCFPAPQSEPTVGPAFYMGTLQPNGLAWDTFLKLYEWTKVRFFFFTSIKEFVSSLMLTFCQFCNFRVRFGLMV